MQQNLRVLVCWIRRGRQSGARLLSRGGERGSGSMLVLAMVPLLVAAGVAALVVGNAMVARHRAAAAADLAALAAAGEAVSGAPSPCRAAHLVAVTNGARLLACRVDGFEVEVTLMVRQPGLVARFLPDSARRARAGPVAPSGARRGGEQHVE